MLAAAGVALLVAAAFAVPAQADNTRVSISNFDWSDRNPEIDLGESVIWDWIGPDTQHSVTGLEPNATQWDSDPGTVRAHPLGDSFKVTFDQPGVYSFQCRLHRSVGGTVTVSNTPGDPNSDPGPQAPLNLDIEPPYLTGAFLARTELGRKGKGTGMNFAIDERGTITADYYKLIRRGKGKKSKVRRSFAGFGTWPTHVGNNTISFAKRTKDFRAKRGKYVALVYATDESSNSTPTVKLKFEIKGKKKKKNGKKKSRGN